jgi:hypothetical protein
MFLFKIEARTQYWPHGDTLAEQLGGNKEELIKTTSSIFTTNLKTFEVHSRGTQKKKKKNLR